MEKDKMVIAFGNDSPVNQAMAKFYGLYAKKAGIPETWFLPVMDSVMSEDVKIREFIDTCNGLFASTWDLIFLPLNIFGTANDADIEYGKNYLERLRGYYAQQSVRIMTWDEFVAQFKTAH